jgi:hypothetical protein
MKISHSVLLLCLGATLLAGCDNGSQPSMPQPPLPTAAAAPLAHPPYTAFSTPLATPTLKLSETPVPIVPAPVGTPITPLVTGWTTFIGKSGFSFSYPTGWYVKESLGTNQPENLPAVTIDIVNYDPALIPPKTIVVPGALVIQLIALTRGEVPVNGTRFMVGPQKLSGLQFVYSRDDPRVEPQFRVFERSDSIYFTNAGGRRTVISGTIYPPNEGVEKYSEIFYQIVGSLRYEPK